MCVSANSPQLLLTLLRVDCDSLFSTHTPLWRLCLELNAFSKPKPKGRRLQIVEIMAEELKWDRKEKERQMKMVHACLITHLQSYFARRQRTLLKSRWVNRLVPRPLWSRQLISHTRRLRSRALSFSKSTKTDVVRVV